MSNYIIFKTKNNTGVIIINRPESLNALNLEMAIEFKKHLKQWEKDDKINNLVLKGVGKAFCAGGDIKSLYLAGRNSLLMRDFFKHEYELNHAIYSFNKPHLTIWNGIVMGGGVGLSLYGSVRIATQNTKFAMPESGIGFFPDVGTSYILSKMNNSIGLYIGLTGKILNYYEVYKLGLANHIVETNKLDMVENYFMENGNLDIEISDNLNNFQSKIINNSNLINDYFSSMNMSTIISKLKSDGSEFAFQIMNHLLKRCPISLVVTCEMFKRAKKMSMKDCLRMDYYLSQVMTKRDDFINGVNEVLIKKSHSPKWHPDSIEKAEIKVKNYFKNMKLENSYLNFNEQRNS